MMLPEARIKKLDEWDVRSSLIYVGDMYNAYSVSIEFHFVNIFFRNMRDTITDLLWKILAVEINNVAQFVAHDAVLLASCPVTSGAGSTRSGRISMPTGPRVSLRR